MEIEDGKLQALETEVAQLRFALASRIVIEQAKGALSVTHNVPPDEAFDLLRRHARSRRQNVHELATEVVRNRGLLPD
jgi:AmiR/NasT family two-component response regulator